MRRNEDHALNVVPILRDLAVSLSNLTGEHGWLAALRFGVAGGLAEAGEADLAEPLFRQLVAENPHHLWAWVGLVDLALVRGNAVAATDIGREALAILPDEPILRRKTAEALDLTEGPAVAIELMALRDIGASDDLAFVIGLHRKAGKVQDAADFCQRMLNLKPDHELSHLARIEIGLQSGDHESAVAAAAEALLHHPKHPEIVLRAAQAYRVAGDTQRAANLAGNAPLDTPFSPWLLQLRASIAEEQGDLEKARLLLGQIWDMGLPEFAEAAREALCRIDAAAAQDPFVEHVYQHVAPAQTIGDERSERDNDFGQLLSKIEIALVEAAPTLYDLLDQFLGSADLPWYRALQVVELVGIKGSAELAESISSAFERQFWSTSDQHAFAIEDLLLRNGPRSALDWIRTHPVARRDSEAAERLGRVLLAAGTGRLAVRYLWSCCRRWPADPHLLELATQALIACGMADRIADLLSETSPHSDAARSLACHVSAAISLGHLTEALSLCEEIEASSDARAPLVDMIEVSLLEANLTKAEAYAARLSIDAGPVEAALVSRPRATRVGTLLNEARILAALGWTVDHHSSADNYIGDFFLPARTRVTQRAPGVDTRISVSIPELPNKIHVIWFENPKSNSERDQLLAVWRKASRRNLILHGEREAQSWLRDKAGKDAARAFAMAPEREQKADLMMLGTLLVEGGVALSSTQWPSGEVDHLFDLTAGAGMFLDGSGAVVTDVVMSTPGHSVIATAFDKAVASCLSRENDHRWFKTGPGLLTRSLALHLVDDVAEARVTLRALSTLRRLVHPYRTAIQVREKFRPFRVGRYLGD